MFISVDRMPLAGEADWSSSTVGPDVLQIAHDDPKFCTYCVYYVGVLGISSTTFTITASTTHGRLCFWCGVMHLMDYKLIMLLVSEVAMGCLG